MNLIQAIIDKQYNPSVVGLDPRLDLMPASVLDEAKAKYGTGFRAAGEALFVFCRGILDAVADIVPAVKPQSAFFEAYGVPGIQALERTIRYAKSLGLYVILDAKRGDIGSTAEAYAAAYLGKSALFGKRRRAFFADALTVNAYLGSDGVKPFLAECTGGRMIFVLIKTSNPSSGELQNRLIGDTPVYEYMASLARAWAENLPKRNGYHPLGVVAGATYPKELSLLRKSLPNTLFLVPGYGAQGAGAAEIAGAFDKDGLGAVVNSSRAILYAYRKTDGDYQSAARKAALAMKEDLLSVLGK